MIISSINWGKKREFPSIRVVINRGEFSTETSFHIFKRFEKAHSSWSQHFDLMASTDSFPASWFFYSKRECINILTRPPSCQLRVLHYNPSKCSNLLWPKLIPDLSSIKMSEPVIAETSILQTKQILLDLLFWTKNHHTLPLSRTDLLNYVSHPPFYTFIHLINKYLMSTVVIQI